jgi:hypothetical protein
LGLDNKGKSIFTAIKKAMGKTGAKYKLIVNALPSQDGEYWTALLISTPMNKYGPGDGDICKTSPDIPETDTKQNLHGNCQLRVDEQHHSGYVYHSKDKDALLGLCHHLLLDAVFLLWSYNDSLDDSK